MKKILSILLALILCLGMLISCENEEQTQSNTESASEIVSEENSKYYCEISRLYLNTTTSLNDFDPRAGEFYTLIKSYDDFLSGKENQFYKQETIESVFSPGFFEEYHLHQFPSCLIHELLFLPMYPNLFQYILKLLVFLWFRMMNEVL